LKGKEWLIGALPALFLFLIYRGYNVVPLLVLGLIFGFILFMLHKQGAGTIVQNKSKGREIKETGVQFEDIGGLHRAKQELREALDFLKEDERSRQLGIRPLKGILLSGPPGTGKTLLAKAAATYANASFVAASGSEFVEMYVGVGASRIRSLFQEAKRLAKSKGMSRAVIFIDEIDAIGAKRNGQQYKEYDQTLNQLLTEMDGISTSEEIRLLVIAATNRVDMLDPALLRPGRFDRHIVVDLPDKEARLQILKLHFEGKPVAEDIDWSELAKETYGFSGAQLESLANEAAIYALRHNDEVITQAHIAQAIDKVMLGEQTDRTATEGEKRRVAYHELGHAICAEVLRPFSVSQVVLVPRGSALGYVRQTQPQEKYLYTKSYLEEQIMICLAGAVAEEIYYGERSTGSKSDFDQALRNVEILIESGLSRLGIISTNYVSKDEMQKEISAIFDRLLKRTKDLLLEYDDTFQHASGRLIEEERLSGEEFRRLLQLNKQKKEIS
jgi:ATP-dependent metalloprotease FtsH